jgi:putative SOS response-associated peptidase YedK
MCTNYTPTARDRLLAAKLGVSHLPVQEWPPETFPGYEAPIVLAGRTPGAGGGDTPQCVLARFGLVPRWSRDAANAKVMSRRTYNARSETASAKPSFRGPWHERQWALAPMQDFFEPCWEEAAHNDNRAVRWRIARADGQPFAVAGLWERWNDRSSGEIVTSFTLLTVNADGHPLMRRMHRPGDEKRMPVVIAPGDYAAWLNASPDDAMAFMRAMPATELVGAPAPRTVAAPVKPVEPSLF